jgi:hypothetical protein
MHIQQIDLTGSRLVGAITKELGMDGPKHHAVVIGRGVSDGMIYVAELMGHGYQLANYQDFYNRYAPHAPIRLEPNVGPNSNSQVAQNALAELQQGGARYDLIVNNCETFVNRAMNGNSTSSQVVNTALGLAALVGLCYVIKKSG